MILPPHITIPARRHSASPDRTPVYAMVGNPNCGKTTLFNALTGLRQKVGNYPGVTVEQRVGLLAGKGPEIRIVDLPGVYRIEADQWAAGRWRPWIFSNPIFVFQAD